MSPNEPKRRDKQSLHYIVRSGLAGGFAGCVAKTAVAPLDRVKILFQASNPEFQKYAGRWSGVFKAGADIYRDAGVRGLLQGHSATLLRIFPYAAIKFMAYDQIDHILMPRREDQTNTRRFVAGSLSGIISVFCTYPLDLIRVRMAFHTKSTHSSSPDPPTFRRSFSEIYHERTLPVATTHTPASGIEPVSTASKTLFDRVPILKFYRGFTVTVAGMIPYAGISFLCWGWLRANLVPPDRRASALEDLAFGAVSGAVAQTSSYPFEIVRRRMQIGGLRHPERWAGWGETVQAVYRTGGLRGFYVGLSIGYLKIVPMTAISYALWQWGKRALDV